MGAFMGCESLTEIELPACNVQSYAFAGCTALEEASIAKGAAYIDEVAFSDCPALKCVTLPVGIRVDAEAFDNTEELEFKYI